jgi:hypothetical protein
MNISECHVGQHLFFGRPNGQKTLGEVVKVNRTKIKVRTLETRGHRTTNGEVWTVPPSLCVAAEGGRPAQVTRKVAAQGPDYTGLPEAELLNKVRGIYSHLSPENLSCDGELSRTQVARRYAQLKRELKACFRALGREVSESEAYDF